MKQRALILISLVLVTQASFATALLKHTKGSDFVNAAKMVLDDSFTPASTVAKLHSLYALGFLEGVLASDVQASVTHEGTKPRFDLGQDGELGVFKMILEIVEGSPILEIAEGPNMIHALLCARYGTSPEVRSRGAAMLMEISATEARKVIDRLKKERNQKAGTGNAGEPEPRPNSAGKEPSRGEQQSE